MERKNDAIGRVFTETKFVPKMVKNKDGKEVQQGFERVPVPSAPREYTIAGRYTRALTDEEVKGILPPLKDKQGRVLPSVYPTAYDQGTRQRKGRRAA